ncbi:MAG: DNA repair protein RadA [Megasphaera sp.]|jgi:DNA repair protein RadA/Sms|nr:DNA repair protein RadA [Megasphaera sp.]MCH4187279.1 DNA repair protein RadA [Megasphaera sp.]MCH4217245.1 DNA repair protein RadA [Megasphaera sp.]
MAKSKIRYVCSNCGSISSRWLGRCPQCGEWNTMIEEQQPAQVPPAAAHRQRSGDGCKAASLQDIAMEKMTRIATGIGELDRVLGGGIVPGALILLSGDPGIGKSTLVLQIAAAVCDQSGIVLYGSGEESAGQIKLRAQRLGIESASLIIQADTSLDAVLDEAQRRRPALVVVDSIQTMFCNDIDGTPGSLAQIRESTSRLMTFAKTMDIPVIVIGHVTKEGTIAGPRMMEHMVDVVLYFEGERNYQFRVLRSIKNRFGSTNESGLFTMETTGLSELANPSKLLLAERSANTSGSAIAAVMDGMRPLLGEIQALTTRSVFAVPRRTASGMDYNRLIILLAVLEKRIGMNLGTQDVYINVVGGLRITETAADLPIALAVYSSFRDMSMNSHMVVMGEVGLTGDIRRVPQALRRVKEAAQMGFDQFIIPKGNLEDLDRTAFPDCQIMAVATLREAIERAFK